MNIDEVKKLFINILRIHFFLEFYLSINIFTLIQHLIHFLKCFELLRFGMTNSIITHLKLNTKKEKNNFKQ